MARNYRESIIQKELCRYVALQYPTAIFNLDLSGVNLSKTQSGLAKAMRSSKGFPDFVLYEPKGKYHALFIEIKKEDTDLCKKKPDVHGYYPYADDHIAEQAEMIEQLKSKGYLAMFGIGLIHCIEIVDLYMRERL